MDGKLNIKGASNVDCTEVEPKPPEDAVETKLPEVANVGGKELEPNKPEVAVKGRVVIVVAAALIWGEPAPAEKDENQLECVTVAPNGELPKLDEEAMFVPKVEEETDDGN